MRVDFPDGQWADIHSVTEMPRRVTVTMQDMLAAGPEEQNGYQAMREINRLRDTLMAMVVKQWSYDIKLTRSAEDMYELPQAAYDKLREETADHWEKAGFTRESATSEETPTTEETEPAEPGGTSTSSA